MRWKRCSSSSPVPVFLCMFRHLSNVVSNIAGKCCGHRHVTRVSLYYKGHWVLASWLQSHEMYPVFTPWCFPMPTQSQHCSQQDRITCVTTAFSPQRQHVSMPCNLPHYDSPGDQIKGNKVIWALSLLTLWIPTIYQLLFNRISDCISVSSIWRISFMWQVDSFIRHL